MANNTAALYQNVIVPLALERLVARLEGTRYIRRDISPEVYKHKQSLTLELNVNDFEAKDFVTEVEFQDIVAKSKNMLLDKYKHVSFFMTDKDLAEIESSMMLNDAVEAAVDALAKQVTTDFYNLYKAVPYFAGSGTNNAYKTTDIFEAKLVLTNNNVNQPAVAGLTPRAFTDLQIELKVQNVGGDIGQNVLVNAELPPIAGNRLFQDQLLTNLKHISGTASGDTIAASGAQAVGSNSLVLSGTDGSTFKEGDLITFDGYNQQFVVTADANVASGSATVSVYPAVNVEIADTTAATVVGDHDVNLMYTRDFAILAMRALAEETVAVGTNDITKQFVVVDPKTQMSIRLEIDRDSKKKRNEWTFDILYGVDWISRERCVRILNS